MEPILSTILIMVAIAVGGLLVLMFVGKIPDPEMANIVRIGVIAVIVIVLLVLLWKLVVSSGITAELASIQQSLLDGYENSS